MFGDLDWPINALRGFVSISWASCYISICTLFCKTVTTEQNNVCHAESWYFVYRYNVRYAPTHRVIDSRVWAKHVRSRGPITHEVSAVMSECLSMRVKQCIITHDIFSQTTHARSKTTQRENDKARAFNAHASFTWVQLIHSLIFTRAT